MALAQVVLAYVLEWELTAQGQPGRLDDNAVQVAVLHLVWMMHLAPTVPPPYPHQSGTS